MNKAVITDQIIKNVLAGVRTKPRPSDEYVAQALGLKRSTVKSIRLAGSVKEYNRRKAFKNDEAAVGKLADKKLVEAMTGISPKVAKAGSQAMRQLAKQVKHTHARPAITPPLYDPKAAIEDLERRFKADNAHLLSEHLKLKATVRRLDKTLNEPVEQDGTYQAVRRSRWYNSLTRRNR